MNDRTNGLSPIAIALEPDTEGAVRSAARAGLNEFNFSRGPHTDVVPIVFGARSVDRTLVGGLVGELRPGWKWLYVGMLWVAEPFRIHGIGKQLLLAAEREAVAQGCSYAALDTISFQARGFYEKQGYTIFGVQEDYPPGHRRFFLRKELTD